jgi:hypothetical protein
MKIISYTPIANPVSFTLPPGRYYVGDPCYVLDKLYKELMDIKWGGSTGKVSVAAEELNDEIDAKLSKTDANALADDLQSLIARLKSFQMQDRDGSFLLEQDGKFLFVLPTIHGDGLYELVVRGKESYAPVRGLPVDSGQLSFIDMRLIEKPNPSIDGLLVLEEETTFHQDERSNVSSSVCDLICDPDDAEDDYDDYDPDEDDPDDD